MNPHDELADDWNAWTDAWQSQPTATPDLVGLAHEVARRSRRLRAVRIGELLVAVLSLGNCLRALLLKNKAIPSTVLLGLIALVFGYTLWVQWQRRRQWHARALDPTALIAFEIGRTRTSIRIWRVSTWISMALWVALTLWGIVAMHAGPGPGSLPAAAWALNIAANAAVVLAAAALGWWMGRRRYRRLARLDALHEAMDLE